MTKSAARRSRDAKADVSRIRVIDVKTNLVLDLWRGDVSLAKTFWLFGVVVGICFAITKWFIEFQSTGLDEGFGLVFFAGLIVFYFVYSAFINIAIWRSSNKYKGPKRWTVLAKVMVIVSLSALIVEIYSFV